MKRVTRYSRLVSREHVGNDIETVDLVLDLTQSRDIQYTTHSLTYLFR